MLAFLPPLSPVLFYGILAGVLILELLLLIFLIILGLKQRATQKKLAIFFSGKDAKDLEKVLTEQLKETRALDTEIQELYEISNRLRELVLKSVHKTSVLRFNPFKEVGGNQSFSVALLDGKNSGLVFSLAPHPRRHPRLRQTRYRR
ncbi:MAG: DUF4446 family protein [Candidatus Moraniibacteriota bacterium]